MDVAHIAGKAPLPLDVKAGKTYYWCACGQSKKQPLCDGSHKDTSFAPLAWTADADKTAYFCVCKQTGNSPLCDGSHNAL
jgi:CDGSH-type Zn-finger protein